MHTFCQSEFCLCAFIICNYDRWQSLSMFSSVWCYYQRETEWKAITLYMCWIGSRYLMQNCFNIDGKTKIHWPFFLLFHNSIFSWWIMILTTSCYHNAYVYRHKWNVFRCSTNMIQITSNLQKYRFFLHFLWTQMNIILCAAYAWSQLLVPTVMAQNIFTLINWY